MCDIQRRKITTPVAAGVAAAVTVAAMPMAPVRTLSPTISGEEQVISSNSSQAALSSTLEIIDENERLRKENEELTKELSQMKILYNHIFVLMSNYSNNQTETGVQTVKSLDLLPAKRPAGEQDVTAGGGNNHQSVPDGETSPRLFGVALAAKRARESLDETTEQDHHVLRLQQPGTEMVKSESLDHQGSDNQHAPWVRQCHRANRKVCR